MKNVFRSSSFWIPFSVSLIVTGIFFFWELGYLRDFLPTFPRPPALAWEVAFTGIVGVLLSLNVGLAVWQSRYGHCPAGVKRASGLAGLIGAFTLICPACVLLPASLISVGYFFVFISSYLPLLRLIAVLLLVISAAMLWPRK